MARKGASNLHSGGAHLAAGTLICAIALATTGPARATSIDYGALESLFGEPVTTSVTGSPQRASEVPASMIIVTADDIRRSGAYDIPGILRHVPGIDVMRWTNDQADVAARGYNQPYSPRLLVLVDGRQAYDDDYGYTPWNTLPIELSDIRQIEIVMGSNSALYGFNAVGGVINIITYDPLYDDTNTLSLVGGTQNLIGGAATATYRVGTLGGVRISLGGRRNDDFSTPQQPIDIGTRKGDNREAIDILGHVRLARRIDASLELSHSEISEPDFSPLYLNLYTRYRVSSVTGRISADTDAGLVEATAYLNWFDTALVGSPVSGFQFHVKNPVYVVQLQDIFKPAPPHTLRLSFEYRYNDMATTPIGGAHVFYEVLAGGAMWSWAIMPDLTLTNAARVDHLLLGRDGAIPAGVGLTNTDWNRRSITAISFNSGIVWQADATNTIRVTAARGVQLPNLINFGGVQISTPFGYLTSIPTLQPTIVMNYGLDWDHNLTALNIQVHARLFRQTTKNIVANVGGSAPLLGIVSTPIAVGASDATGLELAIDGTFSEHWRWGLSYTPEAISDHFLPGLNPANTLYDSADTHPVHVVNANLGWADGPWEIDTYLRYESQFRDLRFAPGPNPVVPAATLVRIADYVSVDARAAYRLTDNLTLALSGQNLLLSPQRQTSAAAVERRIMITTTIEL